MLQVVQPSTPHKGMLTRRGTMNESFYSTNSISGLESQCRFSSVHTDDSVLLSPLPSQQLALCKSRSYNNLTTPTRHSTFFRRSRSGSVAHSTTLNLADGLDVAPAAEYDHALSLSPHANTCAGDASPIVCYQDPASFPASPIKAVSVPNSPFIQYGLPLTHSNYAVLGPVDSKGVCGAYIVEDQKGNRAIFKPIDEEATDTYGSGDAADKLAVRKGIQFGEATKKEIAAYLLDHDHFSGVPRTVAGYVDLTSVRTHSSPAIHATVPASPIISATKCDPRAYIDDGTLASRIQELSDSSICLSPNHSTDSIDMNTSPVRITFSNRGDSRPSSAPTSPASQPVCEERKEPEQRKDFTSPDMCTAVSPLLPPPLHLDEEGFNSPVVAPVSLPPTVTLPSGRLMVLGSLQEWCENEGSAEDWGASTIPTEEVHKIGILDIRILNLDRHLGNILVAREQGRTKLIPIDHGFSLPSYRDISDVSFEWAWWKQCKQPFSPRTLAYIASLDPLQDAVILQQLGVADEAVIMCVISTLLLKIAAAAGLTLFAIANMVQRSGNKEKPSQLEMIVKRMLEALQARTAPTAGNQEAVVASRPAAMRLHDCIALLVSIIEDGVHVEKKELNA